MYPDPFNVRLIHDRTIAETLERHGPDHLLRERTRWPLPSIGLRRLPTLPLSRFAVWMRPAPRAGETRFGISGVAPRTSAGSPHPTCR